MKKMSKIYHNLQQQRDNCLLSQELQQFFAPILAILNFQCPYPHPGGCFKILVAVINEQCLTCNHPTIGQHLAVDFLARFGTLHAIAKEKHIETVIE